MPPWPRPPTHTHQILQKPVRSPPITAVIPELLCFISSRLLLSSPLRERGRKKMMDVKIMRGKEVKAGLLIFLRWWAAVVKLWEITKPLNRWTRAISVPMSKLCVYSDRITAYTCCAEHLFADVVWTHSLFIPFPSISLLSPFFTLDILFSFSSVLRVCARAVLFVHDAAYVWFCSPHPSAECVCVSSLYWDWLFLSLCNTTASDVSFANSCMLPLVIHILQSIFMFAAFVSAPPGATVTHF